MTTSPARDLPEDAPIWMVSLRPGVPISTAPIDVNLPGMPRGFYTILEGHPRGDGGWDVELVSSEHFVWH